MAAGRSDKLQDNAAVLSLFGEHLCATKGGAHHFFKQLVSQRPTHNETY